MQFNLILALSFGSTLASQLMSSGGRCGPQFANSICGDDNPYGKCCSAGGYCGSSDDHCKPSLGCQSGCAPDANPGYTDTDRCGKANKGLMCNPKGKFGECCSSGGYCGSGDGFCLPSKGCQSGCSKAEDGYSLTDRCGSANQGLMCSPKSEYGPCCSEFGFCGKTDFHCLVPNGCQSGCKNTTSTPAPTSTAKPSSSSPATTIEKPTSSSPSSSSPASSKPATSTA
ncbi:hypothetical protein DSO57_1038854 [Entomophthora muscae]|uniref:Uncharacterized protein n=1 Tax=Entomophthora muscae TaxID=34485 RepID=A0ACC2SMT2_9FUNG|nr:hypothetical protein DSO57_1038854 [Entomophthora muscae]